MIPVFSTTQKPLWVLNLQTQISGFKYLSYANLHISFFSEQIRCLKLKTNFPHPFILLPAKSTSLNAVYLIPQNSRDRYSCFRKLGDWGCSYYVIMITLLRYPDFGSLGITPTFIKLDSCSPGAGFYSYYIQHGNKSDKERKIVRKKLSFMHIKRFNRFFKIWVQFRVGAIPRLPRFLNRYFS